MRSRRMSASLKYILGDKVKRKNIVKPTNPQSRLVTLPKIQGERLSLKRPLRVIDRVTPTLLSVKQPGDPALSVRKTNSDCDAIAPSPPIQSVHTTPEPPDSQQPPGSEATKSARWMLPLGLHRLFRAQTV